MYILIMPYQWKFFFLITLCLSFPYNFIDGAACSVKKSDGTDIPNTVANNRATCDTANECALATIRDCDALDCSNNACERVTVAGSDYKMSCASDLGCQHLTVLGASELICRGTNTCQYGSLYDIDLLQCTGYYSCYSIEITTSNEVECSGPYSCMYAHLFQAESVSCTSDDACYKITIDAKQVACEGYKSCEHSAIFNADVATCIGVEACSYSSVQAKSVKCNGEKSCWRSYISAEDVACAGSNACGQIPLGNTPSVIIAACQLVCEDEHSCGENLWFLDKSVPNAKPVLVETGKIQTLGSGCPKTKIPKKISCFSKLNNVEVHGKGVISMDDLQIGDLVRTGPCKNHFSRVLSFMHRDPVSEGEFLQIIMETSSKQQKLEISPDHLVLVGTKGKIVPAKDIKVGDVLGTGSKIVSAIHTVQHLGLYAPVTENGYILVSGVPASCYVALLDENGVSPTWQNVASHAFLAPLRLACLFDFSICQNETYSEDGFAGHLKGVIEAFGLVLSGLNIVMQQLVLILCFPSLIGLTGMEMFTSVVLNHKSISYVLVAAVFMSVHHHNKIWIQK